MKYTSAKPICLSIIIKSLYKCNSKPLYFIIKSALICTFIVSFKSIYYMKLFLHLILSKINHLRLSFQIYKNWSKKYPSMLSAFYCPKKHFLLFKKCARRQQKCIHSILVLLYDDGSLWKLSKAEKNRFVSNLRGGGERSVLTSHVTNDRVSIQIGWTFFSISFFLHTLGQLFSFLLRG